MNKCKYIHNVTLNVGNCCVTLDQVGECVINKLGTMVVVVVVVAVVVGLYADIHHKSFILVHRWRLMPLNVNHSNVEGLCPGTPYRSTVKGSCPGML